MDTISFARQGLQWSHELLEMVTADLTAEQAEWQPTGIANPAGALYAHGVIAEDAMINAVLKGGAPLFATEWAGKTGVSQPAWQMTLEWARGVKVDLPAFRQYAQAVYKAADDYVASLSAGDLDRIVDLNNVGLGEQPVGWCLNALVISHLNNMAGEISALKGVQGAKGYPF
ncbi:MAG: DinB family protein [Chloroflexi bacterium]|nr:DinB family protein [Chloroflexota bacterium]MCI0576366.1 DinB family protein [Chloroflexota bacterium]MCI0646199.1 DinB family protein [Chloroflexota bacterium]MCI0726739.1 DinB family protein [Chloroflexota bacterium]